MTRTKQTARKSTNDAESQMKRAREEMEEDDCQEAPRPSLSCLGLRQGEGLRIGTQTRMNPEDVSMEELRGLLDSLPKSELLELLSGVATTVDGARIELSKRLLHSSGRSQGAYLLQHLKRDIDKRSREIDIELEREYGSKYHLRDEATPTVMMVRSLSAKHLTTKLLKTCPVAYMKALALLADALGFDPEGRIYDFDGDAVLQDLDDKALAMLSLCKLEHGPDLQDAVGKIACSFKSEHWQPYQAYGLFEDIKLRAAAEASKFLQELAVNGAGKVSAHNGADGSRHELPTAASHSSNDHDEVILIDEH